MAFFQEFSFFLGGGGSLAQIYIVMLTFSIVFGPIFFWGGGAKASEGELLQGALPVDESHSLLLYKTIFKRSE